MRSQLGRGLPWRWKRTSLLDLRRCSPSLKGCLSSSKKRRLSASPQNVTLLLELLPWSSSGAILLLLSNRGGPRPSTSREGPRAVSGYFPTASVCGEEAHDRELGRTS